MTTWNKLRPRALLLVWIGEAWNFLEAGVALWAAVDAGSVALLAFGLDSVIEIFAGLVLIWRLGKEWKEEEGAETRALKVVGMTFFLLAVYIPLQSLAILVDWLPEPRESLVGIALVIASAFVMTVLFWAKAKIAKRLGSRALRPCSMLVSLRAILWAGTPFSFSFGHACMSSIQR